MTPRSRSKDWSKFMVAAERLIRVYTTFILPVLERHGFEHVSIENVFFLISIGEGECKVNDIVRNGRYKGSNASYALKALQSSELITRRVDRNDRRNALVCWSDKGAALVRDIQTNSTDTTGHCKEVWDALDAFENHCARSVVI